jgi:phage terminase large subunit-like protein
MKTNIPKLARGFMLPDSHYDAEKAEYAVQFIQALKHTKGEWRGEPFVLLPWQAEIVRTVFGVISKDDYRQCRTCYVFVPKKNGKTMLAAALALYMLIADGEYGAEVYSCAADRAQASLVYREAVACVRQCPALAKRVKILDSTKRIVFPATNSFYQVLSSEAYSHHGVSCHGLFYDELHVADREMFRVMTHGSSDARRQALHMFITTAGSSTDGIGYEVYQKACDIRDGRKIDPTFLPVIYETKPEDDWSDPKVWAKANPSMGHTFSIDTMRRAYESAKQNPGEENSFRQLRLNQHVKQSVRWMPMHLWDACASPVDPEELEGRACYGGLDLSSTSDLTAFVLVFPPEDEDGKYTVLPYFWLPEENVSLRVRRDHVPYDMWQNQKYLFTTEGNVVHYGFIEKFIENLGERYNIREIAYDRWSAAQVVQNLEGAGLTMVPFGQGFKSMSAPTNELMRLTMSRKIAHGGHPVLRWNVDNLFIRTDPAGNIKPDKAKSTEKIDGAVAMIMALGRAVVGGGTPQTASVYDSRGLLFV